MSALRWSAKWHPTEYSRHSGRGSAAPRPSHSTRHRSSGFRQTALQFQDRAKDRRSCAKAQPATRFARACRPQNGWLILCLRGIWRRDRGEKHCAADQAAIPAGPALLLRPLFCLHPTCSRLELRPQNFHDRPCRLRFPALWPQRPRRCAPAVEIEVREPACVFYEPA